MDAAVKKIFETFINLLKKYPNAVKSFDMKVLSDYLYEKAEEFYEIARIIDNNNEIQILRDVVYIYRFSSISIIYKTNKTFLYPFMLITAAHYPNFIPLLCRQIERILNAEGTINLTSFLKVFQLTLRKKTPKLEKRDIVWLKDLSQDNTLAKNFYRRVNSYESKKRYRRLVYLGVIALYNAVNYPILGLTPMMHLASSRWNIPDDLSKFIEFEHHPTKRRKKYTIFRLFLIPNEIQKKIEIRLNEIGTTGILSEYYLKYNWDTLKQTTRYTWNLELDLSNMKSEYINNNYRNDLIYNYPPQRLFKGFISYIEAVHKLRSTNTADLTAKTGLGTYNVKKYQKKSITEKYIIPYWSLSPFIGTDHFYQICFENKPENYPISYLLESLPKIRVMKSSIFHRYLIFLPWKVINKLKDLLKIARREYNVEILVEKELSITDSIDYAVNLEDLLR